MSLRHHAARNTYLMAIEDFDAPEQDTAPPEPEATAPVIDPLPGLIAAARAEGLAEGRAAGAAAMQATLDADIAAALARTAIAVEAGRDELRAVAAAQATEVARLACALLAAAIPSLAERHAEAEVMRFAEAILPALEEEPAMTLRVAPALADAVSARLAAHRRLEVLPDATIEPGDARLRWQGGQATRRAEAARRAIQDLLAAHGLA
jgi:flagellar biosynthesis/type III secretory pathway protein FliH